MQVHRQKRDSRVKEQPPTLSQAATSWSYDLAKGKESTAKLYLTVLGKFAAFLERDGRPDPIAATIDRHDVRRWEAERAETGTGRGGVGRVSPSTLNMEHRALRSFFTWLTAEEDLEAHPMSNVRAPKAVIPEVHVLTKEEYAALLGTATAKTFEGRRNEALLRFLWSTGARLGEIDGLTVEEVDLANKLAHVDGKTGPRTFGFDNDARRALDRYLRIRAVHPHATDTDDDGNHPLWLGPKGKLTTSGVYQIVRDASLKTGIHVHPHMFRHTSAHNQLAAGVSELSVQKHHGWNSSRMLARYGASRAQERSINEVRAKMDR